MQIPFKQILLSRISYLELFTRLFVFLVLFIFLAFLSIFLSLGQFGAGESSEPAITDIIYNICPLIIVGSICIFLMVKNYKIQRYDDVKISSIVFIVIIVLYLLEWIAFS